MIYDYEKEEQGLIILSRLEGKAMLGLLRSTDYENPNNKRIAVELAETLMRQGIR